MKKILVLMLLLRSFVPEAKADSIDYWHIFYNKTRIGNFVQFSKHEIVMKLADLKDGDSITINYFRDTHCPDCSTHLLVEDEKHQVFTEALGRGTFNPVSFPVAKLLEARKNGYEQSFEIYYFEGDIKAGTEKILLFRIRLQ
jgi:hypothetical protein